MPSTKPHHRPYQHHRHRTTRTPAPPLSANTTSKSLYNNRKTHLQTPPTAARLVDLGYHHKHHNGNTVATAMMCTTGTLWLSKRRRCNYMPGVGLLILQDAARYSLLPVLIIQPSKTLNALNFSFLIAICTAISS